MTNRHDVLGTVRHYAFPAFCAFSTAGYFVIAYLEDNLLFFLIGLSLVAFFAVARFTNWMKEAPTDV